MYIHYTVHAMPSQSGAHEGGTDPNAGLHSTVDVLKSDGTYLTTIHVPHDANTVGWGVVQALLPEYSHLLEAIVV